MQYRGFKYTNWIEQEEDNAKIWHEVQTPDGKTVPFDWSPYDTPTYEDFKVWVDVGRPRASHRSLSKADLQDFLKVY